MWAAFRRHVSYIWLPRASWRSARGSTVGFVALQFRERPNYATVEAWVPEMAVAETERYSGVASALFERAVSLARRRECHRLVLEGDPACDRPYTLGTAERVSEAGNCSSWSSRP